MKINVAAWFLVLPIDNIYIYIDILASYFTDLPLCTVVLVCQNLQVGDNRGTVNTSAHFWSVGGRKRMLNTVMLIYLHDTSSGLQYFMCRYVRHFGSFSRYRNPTILETVSIPIAMRILFIEIQWQGIILTLMCLCQGKMRKSKVKNIFSYHFPHWPVGVKPCCAVLNFPGSQ